ncbi:hypothetical protein BGZ61DRAFT_223944 [Ilyonectria robusta]|uniref:uncharacterized protein n=1 Tax=Ilyonectria robusta TaxID=1079257 RepID=UPI001E8CA73D|nr:uncharacterized protein BGZ61DRAFT_223944 [Ilyonectria robusta]KAH8706585.1 hypothetical protein BGZ61DRAFT_223944 [Ilyonectria robusta]
MGSRNVLSATRARQSITQSNAMRDNHPGPPDDHGVSASPHCVRIQSPTRMAIRRWDDEKSHRHGMMLHARVRCPTAIEFTPHNTTQSHDGINSPNLGVTSTFDLSSPPACRTTSASQLSVPWIRVSLALSMSSLQSADPSPGSICSLSLHA